MSPLPPLWPLLLALLVAVLFLAGSLWASPKQEASGEPSRWTRFFLVLLRLAIGWHFLFEGIEKLNNPAWTAEGYLRESVGPLGPVFRGMAGDAVLERVQPASVGELPPALARDLEHYYERFTNYYQLDDRQTTDARTKYDQFVSKTKTWFTQFKKKVPIPSKMPPPAMLEKTIAERVADYERKLAEVAQIESVDLPANAKLEWERLKEAKATANQMRASLKADVEAQYQELSKALHEVFKSAAAAKNEPGANDPASRERPENVGLEPSKRGSNTWAYFTARPWTETSQLRGSDFIVRHGVLVVGALLLLGLLTRTSCVLGALFLLSFYLAMPPLPWLPEPSRVEGNYVFLNKNVIEALALLTLATTRSGRWLGLDALVYQCCGQKKAARPDPPTQTQSQAGPTPNTPEATALSKETPHGS